MKYQMAPLEGITTYIYRNAYAKYYGRIDEYFTPFISPHQDKTMNQKERREVAPENNQGMVLVPQILTHSSIDFLKTVEELKELGYRHVNLNFGCPSATVTTKKKGAGILQDLDLLTRFLDEIFSETDIGISVKTRIGFSDVSEWEEIFQIYERFPIEELIVHPRVREDFYKNTPNLEVFSKVYERTEIPIVYNGNLFSTEDIRNCEKTYPKLAGMMPGRGLIACPALLEETEDESKHFWQFHDEIYAGYQTTQSGDRNVLYRMKELWFYWEKAFAPMEAYSKQIKKAQKCVEYEAAVRQVRNNIPLQKQAQRHINFN